MAAELGAEAPFIPPDARREPYADRNALMGYDPDACIPQPLRPLHAGGDAVLGALARGRGPEASHRADARLLVARHRVRAVRRLLEPSDRRHLREVPRGRTGRPRAGARHGQVDVHVLRRRLPDRPARRPLDAADREGDLDPSYVSNEGNLCVKGRFAFNFVHHLDRLTDPLVRGADGELHPTTWDDALRVAAEGLKGVKERHGAQSVGVLASARLTMEENFLLQKLARTALETHSIHSCEAT